MQNFELLEETGKENIQKRHARLKRTLTMVAAICILAVSVVMLTVKIINQQKEIKQLLDNPIVVTPVAPEIVLDTVRSEMGEISELATEEYLFTNAGRFTDSKQLFKKWNIIGTEKSFVLKWDGKIKAGVDLEKVSFDVKKDTIVVTVPKAEILSYETGAVEVMDEKNNVFNPIEVDDINNFNATTEEEMKERAIENGLLEKAQENAKVIIEGLLTANSELKEFSIEFEIGD